METLRAAALALEYGFIAGGFIVVGLFGGRWLDQRFGTGPLFLMLGLLLGLASSVYILYLIWVWQRREKD